MTTSELFAIAEKAIEDHQPPLDIKGPLLPDAGTLCGRVLHRPLARVSAQEVKGLVESLLQADELKAESFFTSHQRTCH